MTVSGDKPMVDRLLGIGHFLWDLRMRRLIANLAIIVTMIVVFYSIKASVPPDDWRNFWDFMLGDFIALYRKYEHELPSITHPAFLAIGACAVVLLILRGKGN